MAFLQHYNHILIYNVWEINLKRSFQDIAERRGYSGHMRRHTAPEGDTVCREHSAPLPPVSQPEPSKAHTQIVRPRTADEEDEIQIQLALAMSLEEAEQEERKAKSDNMRLQMAIQRSREDL